MIFTFTVTDLSLHRFITNQNTNQLLVCLLAQLVQHCTGIAEVLGSNPILAWIIYQAFFSQLLNPLAPKSDWHLISPYYIIPHSNMKIMSENRRWSLTKVALDCEKKFSLSASLEMYGQQYGEYAYWCRAGKGLSSVHHGEITFIFSLNMFWKK